MITWLTDREARQFGGKAAGLQRLLTQGFAVPNGFVWRVAEMSEANKSALLAAYHKLGGGRVAVRSSALAEDGEAASFAGQYETVLNVEGEQPLLNAIARCAQALGAERAKAYRAQHGVAGDALCIVVQQMVEAHAAGVVFTADPVSGRRDLLIIDAVAGLGEGLVSGELTSDHYEINEAGVIELAQLAGEKPVLQPDDIKQLLHEARLAQSLFDEPLDMEWAIDGSGKLFWLQARPITTLPADLNEFDASIKADDVLTTGNIAEMMPGAVCPLTMSTTLRAIEHAFQQADVWFGAQKKVTGEYLQVVSLYGHFFFNLSGKVAASAYVAGMSAKEAGYSICGEEIPDLVEPPKKVNALTRAINGMKFFHFVRRGDAALQAFEAKVRRDFHAPKLTDPAAQINAIDGALWWLLESEEVHVRASSVSAVYGAVLQGVLSKGARPTQEQMGELSALAAGATGVISAELVAELDQIMARIAHVCGAEFVASDANAAWDLLQQQQDEQLKNLLDKFMARHGHRAYRELCVREQSWRYRPAPLMETMQVGVRARLNGQVAASAVQHTDLSKYPRIVRWLTGKLQHGIRLREQSKSLLVYLTQEIGESYRQLANSLVAEHILPDADLIYFFTHEELRQAKGRPSSAQVAHAQKRREAMAYQQRLSFPFISKGKPVPLRAQAQAGGDTLLGRSVSVGVVEGPCRVALTIEEARAVQPGEILIAPITDVAWTPYFSVIAGLATDIGSSLSHGAVIAREYGLPAVVNLQVVTKSFATGEWVRLDGGNGSISRIAAPVAASMEAVSA